MNKVTLIGRLTKDVELRFTPGTGSATASVTLAVDKYNSKTGQKEADFIPVVFWNKQAEALASYCSKGSKIAVSGRIQTRSYEANDGTKRYVTEVVADSYNGLEFLSSNTQENNNNSRNHSSNEDINFPIEDDITPVDDGDMPF